MGGGEGGSHALASWQLGLDWARGSAGDNKDMFVCMLILTSNWRLAGNGSFRACEKIDASDLASRILSIIWVFPKLYEYFGENMYINTP